MRRFHHASSCFSILCALTISGCLADDLPGEPIAETGGAGDETGGEEQLINWVPSRGISIIEIEANQGTRVPVVGEDGAWIGATDRSMRLISDRDTLIRVHWVVDPAWVPHDVKARLTVEFDNADPIVREQIITVEGDSTRTALDRTFYFGLVAEHGETAGGARIQVELFEADVDQNSALPEAVNIAPASEPKLIGFETTPMELKVMMVPIHYTGGGKDRLANLDEANVQVLLDALYESNPVQVIEHQVHSEVPYAQQMNSLGSLLPIMSMLKQSDGADPNVYYHAFIDIGCPVVGCGNAGVAGIAQLTGDGKNASLSRVGATVLYTNASGSIDSSADTFVHEVGHNQGFSHVACPGANAAGPDPLYPYPNGKIGEWGFGIRSFSLHNPTASHDYMTYCGNTWTSDWTFDKAYHRISTLTSWDYEGAPAGEPDPMIMGEEVLVGALYPDGTEEWFTLDGGINLEQIMPGESIEFEVRGEVIDRPVEVRTMSDGETQWVVAPMPKDTRMEAVDRVRHVRGGEVRRELPASEVRVSRY